MDLDLDFLVFIMARFDATTAREMLMEFFVDDGSDEEEVLLDLEEVLIDQNGEIIRTEDIVQELLKKMRIRVGYVLQTHLLLSHLLTFGKSNHVFFLS